MKTRLLFLFLFLITLFGCKEDLWEDKDENDEDQAEQAVLIAFDPDGKLEAEIKWTTFGVPHITADNLESLAYGNAYAYARDNYCTISEQILKVKSERSKYFGPDLIEGSGDSANLISDFGYKSLRVIESAESKYPTFSENSRAMLEGYSKGLNQYLLDVGVENLAPQCSGVAWVDNISPQQLAAYYASTNMLKSSAQVSYLEYAFYANPGDGFEFLPYMPNSAKISSKVQESQFKFDIKRLQLAKASKSKMGSNGWALGRDMTENSKGALLGNPHFPIAGNLRFWQSHLTIPQVMNVMGGSLQGHPFVQMGFNENIAWTHTVSNSDHSVFYQLSLGDDRQTYLVDGESRVIDKSTYNIEVNIGNGELVTYSKDYFYSHHGIMIELPASAQVFGWDDNNAYTLRDAASENWDSIDHWLGLNLAKNLQEFQQTFIDYNGTAFVNTLYADKTGETFYVNDSNVLSFSQEATDFINSDPELNAIRDQFEVYILPGDSSLFEPTGISGYSQAPKLQRTDFVQNSNDSFWLTNPEEPLSGYSKLYGSEFSPVSLRTRLSLKMLSDSAGANEKFSVDELESALFNNRSYLAELVLPDLIQQCQNQANTPVVLQGGMQVDIEQACGVLSNWDGTFNTSSRGAHLFREFANKFNMFTQLSEPFNPNDAANTPNTLSLDGTVMQSFAAAVANLEQAGISIDEEFGQLQFFEKTLPNGQGASERFPWAGPNEIEGGFNVQSVWFFGDTRLPVNTYQPAIDVETTSWMTSGLSSEGYSVTFSSSWIFAVSFEDNGPQGKGLLMNSQSSDSRSPHFEDQSRHYSNTNSLRPLVFTDADIDSNLIEILEISSSD